MGALAPNSSFVVRKEPVNQKTSRDHPVAIACTATNRYWRKIRRRPTRTRLKLDRSDSPNETPDDFIELLRKDVRSQKNKSSREYGLKRC